MPLRARRGWARQLGDGADRPHAAASTRDAATRASNVSSRSGARSSIAARWRAIVASSPRATGPVSACSAPVRGPVLERGAGERDEQLAGDAGGGGEPLGRALERDEEVGGDRGGGVVGGAVLVGDLDGRVMPQRAAPALRATSRARARRRARRPRSRRLANGAAPPSGTVISGCRLKPSWSPSGVEGRRAGAVADQPRSERDRPRPPLRISRVGHGEQHDVGPRVARRGRAGPRPRARPSRSAAARAWPSRPAPTMAQR